MSAPATPAIALVQRQGIAHAVHPYDLPASDGRSRAERPDYGTEAAAALGRPPGAVGKTLVALVDGRPAVAVIPVDRQLDLKAFAAAVGGRHATLADPATAERAAGSVVGGISPLAMRRPLPTVVDATLAAMPAVCVSAGRRGLQLELAGRDLVTLSEATVAAIAR